MENLHKLASAYFENNRGVVLQESEEESERLAKARRKVGRYTLEEAAFFVQTNGRADARSILDGLMDAVAYRTLAIYEPGQNGRNKDDVVRPWRDEAYWSDLNDWLENSETRIGRIFPSPEGLQAVTGNFEADSVTTAASVTRVVRLRRNALDPAIDEAIDRAGCTKLADVYSALKALALDGRHPFTGEFDGNALCYTHDENVVKKLSKKALGKRLARRKPH